MESELLTHIKGNTYSAQIGIADVLLYIFDDGKVVFLDTGSVDCPELLDELDRLGLTPIGAICTHIHWDHIHNNKILNEKYGARIWLPHTDWEKAISVSHPTDYTFTHYHDNNVITIHDTPFRTILAPGHTPGHHLLVTPDNVCMLGDAMSTTDLLSVFKMPFMEDMQTSLMTLENLRSLDFAYYTASHRGTFGHDQLQEVIDQNVNKELYIYNTIRSVVTEEISIELAINLYVKAIDIRNPRTYNDPHWRSMVRRRMKELVRAGELQTNGDSIWPAWPS